MIGLGGSNVNTHLHERGVVSRCDDLVEKHSHQEKPARRQLLHFYRLRRARTRAEGSVLRVRLDHFLCTLPQAPPEGVAWCLARLSFARHLSPREKQKRDWLFYINRRRVRLREVHGKKTRSTNSLFADRKTDSGNAAGCTFDCTKTSAAAVGALHATGTENMRATATENGRQELWHARTAFPPPSVPALKGESTTCPKQK